jgi:glutathione synthase
MHTLFVIDALDTLTLETETSLLLMEELARRGYRNSVAGLPDLYLTEGGAGVRARSIGLDLRRQPFYSVGPAADHRFADFDLVLFRKDPPVDEPYLTATYVLERAASETAVVNDPVSLRTVNEKLLPLQVPRWTPPTLVSNDAQRLAAFVAAHGRVVLKPLTHCSGRGIRVVDSRQRRAAVAAYLAAQRGNFVIAQQFLPGVAAGDKRIFVLAGEAIGAVNRVPCGPRQLANIHQGAKVEATRITARERAIVAALRPLLVAQRLWMAGIDVIDGYLTEVNVTSPSAARQINQVSGARIEVAIVDFLEKIAADYRLQACAGR